MCNRNLHSHPLHGFEPNEVDDDATIASGAVTGVKNAAIRKLDHELGIVDILPSDFKYLTRLHYWAADVVTHGQSSPWGEHEIDYILFIQVVLGRNNSLLFTHNTFRLTLKSIRMYGRSWLPSTYPLRNCRP